MSKGQAVWCAWYIFMGTLTYGPAYNAELKFQTESYPDWKRTNRGIAEREGWACAMLWPVYWLGRWSREVCGNDW